MAGEYDNSTTYSYDIHGNVDTLLHNHRTGLMAQHSYNKYKTMAYRYDLISGKVNEVHYQPGMPDELYHRYDYDAENRLTNVYTTDRKALMGITGLEEHEAFYQYYKHGPLARTVLGQQQVQGIDYAYTLQGWLKGVNTDNTTDDVNTGKDAYNYSLHYFSGDYTSIGNTISIVNAAGNTAFKNLYNGNIGAMAVNIKKLNQPLVYNYKYDQLNRLVTMDAYKGWNGVNIFAPDKTDEYHEEITYDANGNIKTYKRNGNAGQLNMDNLTYGYNKDGNNLINNRLRHVKDAIGDGNYTEDIDNQGDDNYSYDAIGNLIKDVKEGIDNIEWSVYGKIKKIIKTDGSTISYTYDVAGNRISKVVIKAGVPTTTWYTRDASGNTMAVYTGSGSALTLSEQHIYGSSRLGVWNRNIDMDVSSIANNNIFTRGNKFFELTNHLGNVLVTISDRKFYVKYGAGNESNGGCDQGTAIDNLEVPIRGTETSFVARVQVELLDGFESNELDDFTVYTDDNLLGCEPQTTPPVGADYYYMPDVVSATDYYPFGMMMPGRKYTATNNNYRYGFNGKEKDNEVSGDGNLYDYGFRIYNPRLGRFLSTDPLTTSYPWYTPYQFAGNMPIVAIDLDGLEEYVVTNYYDKKGNLNETVISILTKRHNGQAVNQKLQKNDGTYITEQNVLIRNVSYDGATSYTYQSGLNKQQKDIVAKATKKLIKLASDGNYIYYGGPNPESDPAADKGEYLETEGKKYGGKKYVLSKYSSKNIAKSTSIKKPKVTLPQKEEKPLPVTKTLSSNINFESHSRHVSGDPTDEINQIVSMVKGSGVSDYSITVLGNIDKGGSFDEWNTRLKVTTVYKNYGELALARANKIKELLVGKGLDPSKINVQLGDPNKGMTADYKVSTTAIK